MHAAIIKLNTLANAIRPTTQNDDFFLVAGSRLALFLIGRVHISGIGGKFCGAGIHPFVDRMKIEVITSLANISFRTSDDIGESAVGKTFALEPIKRLAIEVLKII